MRHNEQTIHTDRNALPRTEYARHLQHKIHNSVRGIRCTQSHSVTYIAGEVFTRSLTSGRLTSAECHLWINGYSKLSTDVDVQEPGKRSPRFAVDANPLPRGNTTHLKKDKTKKGLRKIKKKKKKVAQL